MPTRREIADDFAFARRVFDVRGFGLLAGVRLDDPDPTRAVTSDFLKIRPPLVFDEGRVDVLVSALDAT